MHHLCVFLTGVMLCVVLSHHRHNRLNFLLFDLLLKSCPNIETPTVFVLNMLRKPNK